MNPLILYKIKADIKRYKRVTKIILILTKILFFRLKLLLYSLTFEIFN